MYIVQTVHTGLMLDVHCADCTYRTNVRCTLCRLYIQELCRLHVKMYIVQTVNTGLMLDVHCADCTYRTNVICTLCRLYIRE